MHLGFHPGGQRPSQTACLFALLPKGEQKQSAQRGQHATSESMNDFEVSSFTVGSSPNRPKAWPFFSHVGWMQILPEICFNQNGASWRLRSAHIVCSSKIMIGVRDCLISGPVLHGDCVSGDVCSAPSAACCPAPAPSSDSAAPQGTAPAPAPPPPS